MEENKIHDEQFTATDQNGDVISGLPYLIIDGEEKKHFGRTDKNGNTRSISSAKEEKELEIYWGDKALTMRG